MVDFNLIRSINSFVPPPPFPRLFQYQFAWLNNNPIRGFSLFSEEPVHGKFTGEWLFYYLDNIFTSPNRPDELERVFKNLEDLNCVFRNEEYDEVSVRYIDIELHSQTLTGEWQQNLIILEQLLLDLLEKYPDYTIACMGHSLDEWIEHIQDLLVEEQFFRLEDPENVWPEIRDSAELVMSTKELIFGYALYLVKKLFEKCIDSTEELMSKLLSNEFGYDILGAQY